MVIEEAIRNALARLEIDKPMFDYLYIEITKYIREKYGGSKIYVPGKARVDPSEVKRFFNGRNIEATMEHFKISKSRVYQIINDL
tara:strand:+ start:129 stop:383 length:255 start_codon:yes stop_codon:yes gene_type:complete